MAPLVKPLPRAEREALQALLRDTPMPPVGTPERREWEKAALRLIEWKTEGGQKKKLFIGENTGGYIPRAKR